jgi:hypothetical protein
MRRIFLLAAIFLIAIILKSQSMQACDVFLTIAAVLAILILIVLILTIIVSFSLKRNFSERYKLCGENKIKNEEKNKN